MAKKIAKNTICLWYDKDAEAAARFYAETFPDSAVTAVHRAPGDYPSGKQGDVLTVEFTVVGVPCIGINGGLMFKHSEAFSFQIATDDQAETDRYWNAIVGNGGAESMCGWCKDKWGLSWQITPRALTEAMAAGGAAAKRVFEAMMTMKKIDIAKIEGSAPRLNSGGGNGLNMTAKITGEAQIEVAMLGKVPLGNLSGRDTLYYDPATDRFWELTYPESQAHRGVPRAFGEISTPAARVKYALVRDWQQPMTFTRFVRRFRSCCPVCKAVDFDYQPEAGPDDGLGARIACPECGWTGLLGDRDVVG